MRHRQAALGHHLYQVPQTELEPKILAHAQDDDFAVEVATLKQVRYRLQLAHRGPQPVQHDSVADPTAPFAPEPYQLRTVLGRGPRPAAIPVRQLFTVTATPYFHPMIMSGPDVFLVIQAAETAAVWAHVLAYQRGQAAFRSSPSSENRDRSARSADRGAASIRALPHHPHTMTSCLSRFC
jgi:hypothetical protein